MDALLHASIGIPSFFPVGAAAATSRLSAGLRPTGMHETASSSFSLECPADGQALPSGRQTLRGWLVAKSGHHFVDLRVRTSAGVRLAVYGHPRIDLAQFFRVSDPFLPAGFEISLDLTPGEVRLEFEACDLSGQWQSVADAVVTVVSADPAAGPGALPRPLRAYEYARALRQLLRKRRGEPARPLSELAAAVVADIPWPSAVRFPHQPLHGHLDEPAAVAGTGYGRLQLLGWLFHETAQIRGVYASCDLQVWEPLRHGGPFAGVKMLFPEFARSEDCALEGRIDVPAQLPQPRCLRVCAELDDGSWHLAHVVRTATTGTEQEKARYARYSALTFWRAHRTLRAAFHAAGVPVESGADRQSQVWATWREYRARAPRRPTPIVPPDVSPVTATAGPLGRILLVTHNLKLEGAPLFLWEFARHLAKQAGAQLTVATGEDGPLRAGFEALGARVQTVDLTRALAAGSARRLRCEVRALAAPLECAAADLVVANTLACFWAVHAAHAAGRPSLFYIHESTTPEAFFRGQLAPDALPVVEEAFARATRVSFLTTATRRYYDDLAVRSNYCINPGWIDLRGIDAYRAAHSRAELRAGLGLRDGDLLVVNVASVCERKGQTIFARAVDLLWRRDPALAARTHCLMIGGRNTRYDGELAALLHLLQRPHLEVRPETPDVYAAYNAADLAVCTSYEESFPRVILEAMGFALPIATTNVHGIPEIVRSGREAILVPPGDTWALADAMQHLLADQAQAGALAAAARRRVEDDFTIERVMPRHHALASALAGAGIV